MWIQGNNMFLLVVNPLTPIKVAHIENEVDVSPFQEKKDKRFLSLLSTMRNKIKRGTSQQTNKQDGKGRHDKVVYH